MVSPIGSLDSELTVRVFAVLAHSLWQAALLAMGTWVMLRWLPAREAELRYGLCLAALTLTVMVSAGTWTLTDEPSSESVVTEVSSSQHGSDGTGAEETLRVWPLTAKPVTASEADMASEIDRTSTWQSVVVIAWLVGVGLMLLRVSLAMHQSMAMTADASSVPEQITQTLEAQCKRLGISRHVAVALSERVDVPGVIGVFWPTLVLPLSLGSGLTPNELQAIIVHELVHIRRHDFAVNLVQMLVESLYFFNPAVWWLSRRVRIEREACVDSAVVRLTGESLEYATLLGKIGRQLVAGGASDALVGLAGRSGEGTLLERVKRVVEPGISPRIRLPWATLFVVLLLSALGIAAVWQGTSAAVTLAQRLLTDEERVESLSIAREEYGRDDQTIGRGQGTIRGTIRTEDGGPLPKGGMLYYQRHRQESTYLGTAMKIEPEFSCEIGSGSVYLLAESDGYAPAYIGPFLVRPNEVIEDVEIVLPVGFEASIRVVDEEGSPVRGATVYAGLMKRGGSMGASHRSRATDAEGMVHLDHVAEGTYRVTVRRSGYEPLRQEISFSPRQVLEIQLEEAKPFSGQVVSVDGEPVGNAEIRVLFERHPDGSGSDHGSWGPVVVTTDEEGRFELKELKDGWSYALLIESDRWGTGIMEGVAAGETGTVAIGPKLTLQGEIRGPLEELEVQGGRPCVRVFQSVESAKHPRHTSRLHKRVPVQIKDGIGRFECSSVVAGEAVVRAGKHRATARLSSERPEVTVSIDLSKPIVPSGSRREVVLRFVDGERLVAIEGTMRVNGFATKGAHDSVQKDYSGIDGTISIEVPVPGRIQCTPVNVVGWYFTRVSEAVEPGDEPLRIDVPVIPGGAVQGRVTFPTGYSQDDAPRVSVLTRRQDGKTLRQETISAEIGSDGRFFATPIPLGAECSVKLWAGHNVQVSELFTLEASAPLREVNLRLPEPVTAIAAFVDPEGQPVPDLPVELYWEQPGAGGHSWESSKVADQEGRIEFRGVNAEVPQYFVRIDSHRTWQPALVPLRVDRGVTRIELKRGERLAVTAIDSKSGHPVPGVEVYAIRPTVLRSKNRYAPSVFEAEARTDDLGKAWFSNLPDAPVQVGLRGMSATLIEVHPGRVEQVEVRGEIPEWSDLKPRALMLERP